MNLKCFVSLSLPFIGKLPVLSSCSGDVQYAVEYLYREQDIEFVPLTEQRYINYVPLTPCKQCNLVRQARSFANESNSPISISSLKDLLHALVS